VRRPTWARLRQRAGALLIDNVWRVLARASRFHPLSRPERHRVEIIPDVPYRGGGMTEHLADIYRPLERSGPLPIVLYVHGGGFRFMSKDTHWLLALAFARRGYLVVNVSYRLAPRHPFPAAVEDVCAAYVWLTRHAAEYGGDLTRLALTGESAGANLVTMLAVASSWRRQEPWARAVFDAGVAPRAVLPICGMLQVSDPGRFARRRKLPLFIADRVNEVAEAYLFGHDHATPEALELADPLRVLEGAASPPERPLPPFFAAVGTRDPVLDDTRRLERALAQLGAPCEAHYYRGEPHAFHALLFRPAARDCWRRTFAFLDRTLASPRAVAEEQGAVSRPPASG
jgi:acetyl esterase